MLALGNTSQRTRIIAISLFSALVLVYLLVTSSNLYLQWEFFGPESAAPKNVTKSTEEISSDVNEDAQKGTDKVHLVVAATKSEDYSWAENLDMPGLVTLPYIADDKSAKYHPPANRGREATIYLQYMYDFYNELPEVSIFTHASETSWHVERILQNMSNIVTSLSLPEVQRRKYVSLRVAWQEACPAWLHTHSTDGFPGRPEGPFMVDAFQTLFPEQEIPELWSTPCCSQFAVSREAIRSVPRNRYKEWIDWLLSSKLDSLNSGRLWEHFWPYIWLGKSVDCPVEWKAYCMTFGICFESQKALEEWNSANDVRAVTRERLERLKMRGGGRTGEAAGYTEKIERMSAGLDRDFEDAVRRGRMIGSRRWVGDSLFDDSA